MASVIFWKRSPTIETLLTLPKPLVHLLRHLVNFVLGGGEC